jgi:hypothetical protein
VERERKNKKESEPKRERKREREAEEQEREKIERWGTWQNRDATDAHREKKKDYSALTVFVLCYKIPIHDFFLEKDG